MNKARKAHGDKVILDDVTLAFYPGAKIGVVGPNGAGKSSVLKIMAGLDNPSNGEARLAPDATVGILMQEQYVMAATNLKNINMHGTHAIFCQGSQDQNIPTKDSRTKPASVCVHVSFALTERCFQQRWQCLDCSRLTRWPSQRTTAACSAPDNFSWWQVHFTAIGHTRL